jgi:serine/threonine protein kinase
VAIAVVGVSCLAFMSPSFDPGLAIHQRYNAIAILGQAAYGRTYLAEDRGRFNELCVLKELDLTALDPAAFERARDRFQAAANQLYRLQHRQIPRFRATFSEEQRLFWVQDYIEGQSLEDIWRSRQCQDRTLSETETQELCKRLLPILDTLHRQNIICGNIRPDCIVLRPTLVTPNRLEPVLVGLDARLACLDPISTDYSPPEQRQGEALAPSSDLYSLAATAVVVLTGKEPKTLYNAATQTWEWQDYAQVSEELAAVLHRLLLPHARDRYASALDVLQALQPLPPPEMTNPTQWVQPALEPALDSESALPSAYGDPVLHNPLLLGGLTLALGLVAGASAWVLVSFFNNAPFTVSPVPTPLETIAATPTPSPEVDFRQRLTLPPGQTLLQRGTLRPDSTVEYILRAEANREVAIALESEGIWFTFRKPNREIVELSAELVKNWQGRLPESGDYILQLIAIPGLPQTDYQYQLEMALSGGVISSPTASPAPSPPPPAPLPSNAGQTLTLPPVVNQPLILQAQTSPQRRQSYLVSLEAGQTFEAAILEGRVTLNLYSPDGEPIQQAQGVQYWQGRILRGGQYRIDAIADRPREFTMSLSYVSDE